LQGWLLFGEDPFSNNPVLTQIVDGPGDPPGAGDGSVKLDPTAFGGFVEGNTQAVLRTMRYAGTRVGDIGTLAYSIFVPDVAGDPPTMQLAVVGNFTPNQFSSLVFIPGEIGNEPPQLGGWKDYTPSQTGNWGSTRDILDGNGNCLLKCSIGGCGTRATACNTSTTTTRTWAEIKAGIPNAVLNGPDLTHGSFSFRIGRGETGQGNLTNVVFNNDEYVFETD
jgi:hypothetical protein